MSKVSTNQAFFMAPSSPSARALDRLKKAANLVPSKKTVTLSDGTEFEFWHTSLTMAERERATKAANSQDPNAFAINYWFTKHWTKMAIKCLRREKLLN
jgi:hypothetical protein